MVQYTSYKLRIALTGTADPELVSNLTETAFTPATTVDEEEVRAQGFRTGPFAATLTSVTVYLSDIDSGVTSGEVTVTIRDDDERRPRGHSPVHPGDAHDAQRQRQLHLHRAQQHRRDAGQPTPTTTSTSRSTTPTGLTLATPGATTRPA